MPTSTINIYIDASFFSTSDGSKDETVEFTTTEADVIGAYNMPIEYTTSAGVLGTQNINLIFTTSSAVSGTTYKYVEYYAGLVTTSGDETCLVDYSAAESTISGTLDKIVEYFVKDAATSGSQDPIVDYTAGQVFGSYLDINMLVNCWFWPAYSGTEDLITNYTSPSPINTTDDQTTEVSFGAYGNMTSGTVNKTVDLTFAGWVNYLLQSDIITGISGTNWLNLDLTTISGAISRYDLDVYCGVINTQYLMPDIYCCLIDYSLINYDVTVISGGVDKLNSDTFSCDLDTQYFDCDIDLLSLKISNFQPADDAYRFASEGISVDITDDVYNVLTVASGITCSGTCCLKVDDISVPVTFSGITDGYRMFYTPTDGFGSVGGSTVFTVRAENSNGDAYERDYYLTYGYLVDYDNIERIGTDFGYNTQVLVRMSAEDMATCPTFSADAYWFITERRKFSDLSANITSIEPEIGTVTFDLPASIYPQSTAFFYGETYRVVLNARDFAGNAMEPYEFEFKIEDAPS